MEAKPITSQRVAGGNRDLIDSIGNLLEAKTGLMLNRIKFDIATNAKELKTDCASLRYDVEKSNESLKSNVASLGHDIASLESELKSDSESLKSSVASLESELRLDMDELKSINVSLKADVEKNAKELKSEVENELKCSRNEIMGHVDVLVHESREFNGNYTESDSNCCT